MHIDYRKAGAWLLGSGVTFAALYLIGTASSLGTSHPAPAFPYFIFAGLFLLGLSVYLLTPTVRDAVIDAGSSGPAELPAARTADDSAGDAIDAWWVEQMTEPAPDQADPTTVRPAVADRWQFTHSQMDAPGLAQLGQQGFEHQAYMRPMEKTPPWVRVRAVVACDFLGEETGWQELRGRFLGLLTHEGIRGLIVQMTEIPDGAIWRPRGTQRRSWLEADMTTEDDARVPAATAQLFLPEDGLPLAGLQRGAAQLTLHIDYVKPTQQSDEQPEKFDRLPAWRKRFEGALTVPAVLAGWLKHDLSLETSGLAQCGIMLAARQSIKEMVDPGNISALSAPYTLNQFTGWAVAKADGKPTGELARAMMLDLSQRVLHLTGDEAAMAGETDSLA